MKSRLRANGMPLGRLLAIFVAFQSIVCPADGDRPLRAVFIDEKTEAEFGAVPLPRTVLAAGIAKIKRAGAAAVIVKFFFDTNRDAQGDEDLGRAVCGIPTVLQAALGPDVIQTNALPEKYCAVGDLPDPGLLLLNGSRGLIPTPTILRCATDVGFVDFTDSSRAPTLEVYDGRIVKSLHVCGLELLTGHAARFTRTNAVWFGNRVLHVGPRWQHAVKFPPHDAVDYLPFHTLMKMSPAEAGLKGAVVVLGYDGPRIPTVQTPVGRMRLHRYWFHVLHGLYDDLQAQ